MAEAALLLRSRNPEDGYTFDIQIQAMPYADTGFTTFSCVGNAQMPLPPKKAFPREASRPDSSHDRSDEGR